MTTTTTIPASMARVTVVNDYPASMVVSMNGVKVTEAANSRKGPFAVRPKATGGNDVVTWPGPTTPRAARAAQAGTSKRAGRTR